MVNCHIGMSAAVENVVVVRAMFVCLSESVSYSQQE